MTRRATKRLIPLVLLVATVTLVSPAMALGPVPRGEMHLESGSWTLSGLIDWVKSWTTTYDAAFAEGDDILVGGSRDEVSGAGRTIDPNGRDLRRSETPEEVAW